MALSGLTQETFYSESSGSTACNCWRHEYGVNDCLFMTTDM